MTSAFLKDSKLALLGQIFDTGLAFIVSILLARVLGPDLRGLLALVILIPMLIKTLVAGGFNPAIVYSVSSELWHVVEIIPKLSGLWVFLSGAMLTLGGAGMYLAIPHISEIPHIYLWICLGLAPLTFIVESFGAVMNGKRLFRCLIITNLISGIISFVACLVLVWGLDYGVMGAILAQIVGVVIKLVTSVVWLKKSVVGIRLFSLLKPRLDLGLELRYGLKSQAANIAAFLNYKVDQLLINYFVGKNGLGLYTVAVGTAEKLWFLINFIPKVILPASASLTRENRGEFAHFVAKLSRICLSIIILAAVVLGLIAEPLVVLVFGEAYRDSAMVLIWLLPGIVALGHSRILANYIAGIGHPGLNAIRGVGAVVVNIALNILLLPRYGITGAAIATSVSYCVSAVLGWIFFSVHSHVPLSSSVILRIKDIVEIYTSLKTWKNQKK